MKNTKKTTTLTTVFAATAILAAAPVHADDVFKGVRGPTTYQLDVRLAQAENDIGTAGTTGTAILKYWDGKEKGKWFFLNAPYRALNTLSGNNEGIGDVTIGGGPRGMIGKWHLISYGALTLPTGDATRKPTLGNSRTDEKLGLFTTYLTSDKRIEFDGAFEYTWTGENKASINPPNEFYAGIVAGGKTSERTRAVAGFTGTFKENDDYAIRARGVLRGIRSAKEHLELMIDVDLKNHGMPKSKGVTLIYRRNI